MRVYGNVVFNSGAYHPAVFTAVDDNTVGAAISGSTGTPSGTYGSYLRLMGSSAQVTDARFSYASFGLIISANTVCIVRNVQFVNCGEGIFALANTTVNNGLFANVVEDFWGTSATVLAEHCTFANATGVAPMTMTILMTNCVLANITYVYSTEGGGNNGFYNCPEFGANAITNTTYPFQAVGAASYYLQTNGCAFLYAGTTNVDATVLGNIARKTVYPPIVYSNTVLSAATAFSPQAGRDSGTPSLGYHYDPLDYVFSGVNVYSNITFTPGTAVGWFELPNSGGAGYGLSIYDKVVASFNGTATSPCTFARYCTVQEGGDGLWSNLGYMGGIVSQSLSGGYGMNPTNAALISLNFTRCALLSEGPNQFRENNALSQVVARNSEIWNGDVGTYWDNLSATNCLFDRVSLSVNGGNPGLYWLRNCTMHGGALSLSKNGQTWPVWIEDCAFDGTSIAVDDNSGGNINITYCDFNAFLTNGSQLPLVPAKHNVTNLLSFNWQSSWFGNFYQTTNSPLINAGSTTADKFGLYHFTTQTNQVPETNSIVDIGYHYVATDANGNPLDTNGDGIPDYLEDANGNGIFDAGDLGNWLISPYNGLTSANVLSVFTPLK